MNSLIKWFITSIKMKRGSTAIEYALMVSLIAVAMIATVNALGVQLNIVFTTIADALADALP